jgi:hypothetical protein
MPDPHAALLGAGNARKRHVVLQEQTRPGQPTREWRAGSFEFGQGSPDHLSFDNLRYGNRLNFELTKRLGQQIPCTASVCYGR